MHRKPTRPPPPPPPSFDLRLIPSSAEYNALTDPHANYYFVSSAAKQRLKELKRELRRSKHQKSSDEKQTLRLIREKIKFKFPKLNLPLVNQQQLGAIISARQRSEHAFSRNEDTRAGSISRREEALEGLYGQRERLQTDAKKSFSCSRSGNTRRSVNHTDFVQFLAERKSQLLESGNP